MSDFFTFSTSTFDLHASTFPPICSEHTLNCFHVCYQYVCVAMAVAMGYLFIGAVSLFLASSLGLFASPLFPEITSKYSCDCVCVCVEGYDAPKGGSRVCEHERDKFVQWIYFFFLHKHRVCVEWVCAALLFCQVKRLCFGRHQLKQRSLLWSRPSSRRFADAGADATTSDGGFDE